MWVFLTGAEIWGILKVRKIKTVKRKMCFRNRTLIDSYLNVIKEKHRSFDKTGSMIYMMATSGILISHFQVKVWQKYRKVSMKIISTQLTDRNAYQPISIRWPHVFTFIFIFLTVVRRIFALKLLTWRLALKMPEMTIA